MTVLRTMLTALVLFGLAFAAAMDAAFAEPRETITYDGPIIENDLDPEENTARPDWDNPNAEMSVGGVDDDPTPFDLGTNPQPN